jgi:hypothetical protein
MCRFLFEKYSEAGQCIERGKSSSYSGRKTQCSLKLAVGQELSYFRHWYSKMPGFIARKYRVCVVAASRSYSSLIPQPSLTGDLDVLSSSDISHGNLFIDSCLAVLPYHRNQEAMPLLAQHRHCTHLHISLGLTTPALPLAPRFHSRASVQPHARPHVSLLPANLLWNTAEWGRERQRSVQGHNLAGRMTVSS